ncbi:MAG: type IV secretory system conjugative DNA transfer family protein [Patescibacteria group bacterium]|jgi:ABC-type dipeptide/oligopeptide/nickel transport system ATPase component
MRLNIKPNEHLAVVGMTGSGKTYFVHKLARSVRRLVVFDPKGTLGEDSGWNLTDWNRKTEKLIMSDNPFRVRVLAPIETNQVEAYDAYFEKIYNAGNVIVYIDEAYGVTERGRYGKWLQALYTRGRELQIGVWAATQRPTWIPLFMLSETRWLFSFRLQMEVDRRRMAELMGANVLNPIPDIHGFYYKQSDMVNAQYVRQLGS